MAAHAGGAPHLGIDALYAASLGLQACNSLRETFCEKDYVRYHPIINQAGVAANAIPDLDSLDTYVRAASVDAMVEVNRKINRAIGASAAALGAHVRIVDHPGNLPFHSDKIMTEQLRYIIEKVFGENQIAEAGWDTQSSDVGDISALMPVVQHLCMGAIGTQHGDDYYILDIRKAVLNPAKAMLCLVHDLLKNRAEPAKRVKAEYRPLYDSKEEYFQAINQLAQEKDLVSYHGSSEIKIMF